MAARAARERPVPGIGRPCSGFCCLNAAGIRVITMRIAVLVRILWIGGVQRAAIEGVKGLKALGQDCDLIFIRKASSSYELPAGTRILFNAKESKDRKWSKVLWFVTSVFAKHRGRDATVDLDLMIEANRVVREYDLVVYSDQWVALIGLWNKIRLGKPFILFLNEFFRRPPSGKLYPILMVPAVLWDHLVIAFADGIITTSTYNYKILAKKRRRVWLARLGCTEAKPSGTRRRRQVLSLTLWDRGRNPWIYLEIAKSLPDVEFVLAGVWAEEDFREEVRQAARALPNVRITGELSEDERESLLEESLIYLRFGRADRGPGMAERGPGMGGLEALGHGCIVVANSDLGISEIITHGVDGFILKKTSASEAAHRLREILSLDEKRLELLGSAARALCRRVSWTEHAKVILQAANEVMGKAT